MLGREASHDLDRLQVMIDVTGLQVSGYDCADWLREHEWIDVGMNDHRRIMATLSMADDEVTAARLLDALGHLVKAAPTLPEPRPVRIPEPGDLELDSVQTPRDAFFGAAELVPADEAVGRVVAEQVTPYPPGIPVLVPGERITAGVLRYLHSGLEAGMVIPDATDPQLQKLRVARAGTAA